MRLSHRLLLALAAMGLLVLGWWGWQQGGLALLMPGLGLCA